VKEEVVARLKQSLHNAVFINLDKEAQPEQVKRPWSSDIKIGDKPSEPIPDDTSILEVFDQEEIAGKLLILGNPGAGKTTTMLDLAKALVTRSQQDCDYPIPVLFNLSTWKGDKQSIRDWLVMELKSKYGVPKDIGTKWVDDAKLLPMLDGLDELESVRQEPCVRKINDFLQSYSRPLYMVVASRIEEYEKIVRRQWKEDTEEDLEEISTNHNTRLYLSGSIIIEPLKNEQIQVYLAEINQLELWDILRIDAELLEFVRTPLFLWILGFISFHKALSIQDWKILTSREARLKYLLDAYWDIAITRELTTQQMESKSLQSRTYGKKNFPTARQTRKWLICLGKYLEKQLQTEFLIETIQPSMLPDTKQDYYETGSRLIIILGLWLLSGLSSLILYLNYMGWGDWSVNRWGINLLYGIFLVIILGLPWGLFIGVFIPFKPEIKPAELLIFSWTNFVEGTVTASQGLRYIFHVLMLLQADKIFSWLIFMLGQANKIFSWLMAGKPRLSTAPDIVKELLSPNSTIFSSVVFVLTLWLLFGMVGGGISGLTSTPLKVKRKPNQGIRYSTINYLIGLLAYTLSITILITIICLLLDQSVSGLIYGLINGLALSLTISPFVALGVGGRASIQHLLLRLLLYRNNCIPWNYGRFLDYCTERLFIQRVGGRYRFMHRLLQEHFAAMPLEK
jgi:adenylate kinase family enzyme